jgi:hypothetical protein
VTNDEGCLYRHGETRHSVSGPDNREERVVFWWKGEEVRLPSQEHGGGRSQFQDDRASKYSQAWQQRAVILSPVHRREDFNVIAEYSRASGNFIGARQMHRSNPNLRSTSDSNLIGHSQIRYLVAIDSNCLYRCYCSSHAA